MNAKKVGRKLRELRGNLTAAEVAELVGSSVSAILMYENGERVPRDNIKVRLADLYGVSVGSLFFGEKGSKNRFALDRVRSEAGELSTDDLVRISQRILGVLEEEFCTVEQAQRILRFAEEAAAVCTLVKPIKISETD